MFKTIVDFLDVVVQCTMFSTYIKFTCYLKKSIFSQLKYLSQTNLKIIMLNIMRVRVLLMCGHTQYSSAMQLKKPSNADFPHTNTVCDV